VLCRLDDDVAVELLLEVLEVPLEPPAACGALTFCAICGAATLGVNP
jgi:hypothetical protein